MSHPMPFEAEFVEAGGLMMRILQSGGYFRQPRTGPAIMLPKLPPVVGVRRNEPCPCNSGRKFKKCCLP